MHAYTLAIYVGMYLHLAWPGGYLVQRRRPTHYTYICFGRLCLGVCVCVPGVVGMPKNTPPIMELVSVRLTDLPPRRMMSMKRCLQESVRGASGTTGSTGRTDKSPGEIIHSPALLLQQLAGGCPDGVDPHFQCHLSRLFSPSRPPCSCI